MAEQLASRLYLAEVFAPNADSSRLSLECERICAAADALADEGVDVSYVDSLLAPYEETAFYLFEARDAAVVDRALGAAGIDAGRVSVVVTPADSALMPASCFQKRANNRSRSAGTNVPRRRAIGRR